MATSLGRLRNTPIAVGSGIDGYNKKVEALERGSWVNRLIFRLSEIPSSPIQW